MTVLRALLRQRDRLPSRSTFWAVGVRATDGKSIAHFEGHVFFTVLISNNLCENKYQHWHVLLERINLLSANLSDVLGAQPRT
jgi:hypothetical protein